MASQKRTYVINKNTDELLVILGELQFSTQQKDDHVELIATYPILWTNSNPVLDPILLEEYLKWKEHG